MATVKVLRHLGVDVAFPEDQTCCGQIGFNGGYRPEAADVARHFIETFEGYQHIVAPSGSCASMIKVYYAELFADDPEMLGRAKVVGAKTHELSDFIVNVLGVTEVGGTSAGLVTYHDACHLLRELGIAKEPRTLIEGVRGVEIQEMEKSDACCGFGGLFCVKYPEISTQMVANKADDAARTGADTLLGGDLGCLLNIAGYLRRTGSPIRVFHVAEVLADMAGDSGIGEQESVT